MGNETNRTDELGRPIISMAEMGARIAARKAELEAQGIKIEVPRNAGANRTESKRALLTAIEDAGGKW